VDRPTPNGPNCDSLRLVGVTHRYANFLALDDIQLALNPHERLALIGPTGSGKTTLLRMIAGLEASPEGEIWLGDRRISDEPANRRPVSVIFQDRVLYPHLTVAENLKSAAPRGGRVSLERIYDRLGIGPLRSRFPDQLSGGEQQRVAIARALLSAPQILCLDEPFSNLDVTAKADLRHLLLELHDEFPSTWLIVTHDPQDAMILGNRIAVLEHGKLLQVGRNVELIDSPKHRRVAELISDPPMNLIERHIRLEDGCSYIDGFRVEVEQPYLSDGLSILVGFHPQDARLRRNGGEQTNDANDNFALTPTWDFDIHLRSVVPFFDRIRIDGSNGSTGVTVICPASESPILQAGQGLALTVDPSKLLFFDASTGSRLEFAIGASRT
jgi:sn-glycerol 3-phosphate transport system ATP-binding protein